MDFPPTDAAPSSSWLFGSTECSISQQILSSYSAHATLPEGPLQGPPAPSARGNHRARRASVQGPAAINPPQQYLSTDTVHSPPSQMGVRPTAREFEPLCLREHSGAAAPSRAVKRQISIGANQTPTETSELRTRSRPLHSAHTVSGSAAHLFPPTLQHFLSPPINEEADVPQPLLPSAIAAAIASPGGVHGRQGSSTNASRRLALLRDPPLFALAVASAANAGHHSGMLITCSAAAAAAAAAAVGGGHGPPSSPGLVAGNSNGTVGSGGGVKHSRCSSDSGIIVGGAEDLHQDPTLAAVASRRSAHPVTRQLPPPLLSSPAAPLAAADAAALANAAAALCGEPAGGGLGRRGAVAYAAAAAAAAASGALRKCQRFRPLSFQAPHHRSYQLAWAGGCMVYVAAFAPAALMPVMRPELGLGQARIAVGSVMGLAASVGTRVLLASAVRRFGPRYCQVFVLLYTAPVLAFVALMTDRNGFAFLRFLLGASLGLHVVTQCWVVAMFDWSVLGTAAAAAAGLSKAGGGVAMLLLPAFQVVRHWHGGDGGAAWRTVFHALAVSCVLLAALTLWCGQDTPMGDLLDPKPYRPRRLLPYRQPTWDLRLMDTRPDRNPLRGDAAVTTNGASQPQVCIVVAHGLHEAPAPGLHEAPATEKQHSGRPAKRCSATGPRPPAGAAKLPHSASTHCAEAKVMAASCNGKRPPLAPVPPLCTPAAGGATVSTPQAAVGVDAVVRPPPPLPDEPTVRSEAARGFAPSRGECLVDTFSGLLVIESAIDECSEALEQESDLGSSAPGAAPNAPQRGPSSGRERRGVRSSAGGDGDGNDDGDGSGGGSEGARDSSDSGASERLFEDRGQVYKLVLRNPICWLLAINHCFTFGAQLVAFNVLPLYLTDGFHLHPVRAGCLAGAFGLTNIFTRLAGCAASDALSRRAGMRGRLWALWSLQAAGGVFCCLMGTVARGSLGGTAVLLLLFGAAMQMACGVAFSVAPFVSYRGYAAVVAVVTAVGQLGGALLQAAFFSPSEMRYASGFKLMGLTCLGASFALFLLRFPMWGGMLPCGAVEADEWAEERYYAREWSERELAQGVAAAATGFAWLAKAERGVPRGAGARGSWAALPQAASQAAVRD